ncbi:MAG: hypothetical protein NTX98_03515 [Candidatus Doudnabacteria bacterium]|nr:hypothetical protein [Candidatus Doudnabacteria bacterium]
MQVLKEILPNLGDIFNVIKIFFVYGGWVPFMVGLIYMLYYLYIHEIQAHFDRIQQWTFLEIKVPKINISSTLAVESIFSQMHALHRSLTFLERKVEGQFQLWYSLEIISMGGKISFIIRVPKSYTNLVQSAVYSHYPDAEIQEIEDYLKNLKYEGENPDIEIFGTEFKLSESHFIPIRTYEDFEHNVAEEKVIDPLKNLFETLQNLDPWEFFGIQILIRPTQDDEWKPKAKEYINKLIGEKAQHEIKFSDLLLKPFNLLANFSYKNFVAKAVSNAHEEIQSTAKNNWMNMTEGEKQRVSLVEKKLTKPAYLTKIRHLYIAPKGKYNKMRRFEIIGAYRHFSSGFFNLLKIDSRSWTKGEPFFSPTLEKAYTDWKTEQLKRRHFKGYKNRSMYLGMQPMILSVEEIATLYHFPITGKEGQLLGSILSVPSKKSQPPADLPVAEYYENPQT